MELCDLMKYRRSIRRYQDRQIERADLEKIIEAGLYAPSAQGKYPAAKPRKAGRSSIIE